MTTNKKGQIQQLTSIGFGIIGLAVLVGIGLTVLQKLGDSGATCGAGYTWNAATQYCLNATGGDPTTATGAAYTGIAYASTQLGSAGLLGWLPAVIALLIGVFFLMYFMGRKKGY